MALPTAHLLAPVVASLFTTHSSCLDRLGVNDACARMEVPAQEADPHALAQRCVQPLPCPVYSPPPEPAVDGLPQWEVTGQQPPGTAALEHVEDCIEDSASGVNSRLSSVVGRRDEGFEIFPFYIGKIG